MSEVTENMKAEIVSLQEHMKSLKKDSPEYDSCVNNQAILTKSLSEAENAEAERIRKEKERVQAIKQWQAEHALKEHEADEAHAQFMIKTIVETVVKVVDQVIFVDSFDRELLFQKEDSHAFRFGAVFQRLLPYKKR